jgi:hypothetical protein
MLKERNQMAKNTPKDHHESTPGMDMGWGNMSDVAGKPAEVWVGNQMMAHGRITRGGHNNQMIVEANGATIWVTPAVANVTVTDDKVVIRMVAPRKVG